MEVDVVIVGGGAAGIGAARRLAKTRLSTMLIESSARLGGRAWTQEIAGLKLDLGCGWLHSAERNAWTRIAEAAGVRVDRSVPQWGNQYRDLGFSKSERASAGAAFADWMNRLEGNASRSDCAADALDPKCEWNDYIRTIVGFISGGPLEQLSIADYLAYEEASSDFNWRVPSGYGALVAGGLPAQVERRLSTLVESMALGAVGVTLSTGSGVIRAKAVILTVSTAVLAGDTLKLPAELAPWRDAARRLPLGRNEKLFFEVVGDAPFEAETQLLGNPRARHSASYYVRPLGSRAIECFFGGDGARALEEGGSDAGFDFALQQLCALFGSGVRAHLRPLVASHWSATKSIGGAYSYALPGNASARTVLAQPFDNRIFFAGEATSAGDFSTAHGAHDSGVRAADEVAAALN
jgi:monoamine oxidase